MSSFVQPLNIHVPIKPKKKKILKPGKSNTVVSFPVDFFEHCQPLNDIEIGGNDLLQLYNVAQIKHRLNTTGLYLVSTKASGLTVEMTNCDNNMVITGTFFFNGITLKLCYVLL